MKKTTLELAVEALEFYGDEKKYFIRKTVTNLQETTAVFKVKDPSNLSTAFESETFECSARIKIDQGKLARTALDAIKAIQAQHTPTESVGDGDMEFFKEVESMSVANFEPGELIEALNTPEPRVEEEEKKEWAKIVGGLTDENQRLHKRIIELESAPIASETLKRASEYKEYGNMKQTGLLKKYEVKKVSNPSKEIDCIVLEFDDPIARVGILAWANEMGRKGFFECAHQVTLKLALLDSQDDKPQPDEGG